MRYLSAENLRTLGIDWIESSDVIARCARCLATGEYVQPLKPYLRFKDPKNRIIAMPAYVGGDFGVAGIKWIASFPDNLQRGLERANSVVILNDAATGQVAAIIHTALLSVIRTAAVSAVMLRRFRRARELRRPRVGIIGLGPIGRHHLEMCRALLHDTAPEIVVHDLDPDRRETVAAASRATAVSDWRDAYVEADIVITCTVASKPYIDLPPKPGALLLNVSLRDYADAIFPSVAKGIVVDDWDEVCRENTDIERFHRHRGLSREHVLTLPAVVTTDALAAISRDAAVMFNPMGMAVFDVAIAQHYVNKAAAANVGLLLP